MIPKPIPLRSEEVFKLAMRHRSAAENSVADSYERLEFFGDSVRGLVIAEYLYEHHPDWDQGLLSKAKASVVQEGPLAETAENVSRPASATKPTRSPAPTRTSGVLIWMKDRWMNSSSG